MSTAIVTMVIRATRRRGRSDIAAAAAPAPASVIVTSVMTGRIIGAMTIDGKTGAIENKIERPCESLRYTKQSSGSDDRHSPDTLDSVG
jgi:hypothetical protein